MLNILTSSVASNAVQSSVFQVLSEGTLKAIGRPAFTLLDKKADPEARKYSATKELLFQVLSMVTYALIVIPVVKKQGYKMLKKMYGSQEAIAPKLEKLTAKLANAVKGSKEKQIKEISDKIEILKSMPEGFAPENLDAFGKAFKTNKTDGFKRAKGAQEFISILGSGVILTVIGPQIVNRVLHPIMGFLEKTVFAKKGQPVQNTQQQEQAMDKVV